MTLTTTKLSLVLLILAEHTCTKGPLPTSLSSSCLAAKFLSYPKFLSSGYSASGTPPTPPPALRRRRLRRLHLERRNCRGQARLVCADAWRWRT
ncbi:hypothetical protein Cni_G06572 [Canna indica]|uniref:Secreted protein n=1 Tax=Canna indica TaxID=4628 RepID=A0AAQ3JWU8_9LILI|nr:hypothetical protein Cni_G06572 [Canna indica]